MRAASLALALVTLLLATAAPAQESEIDPGIAAFWNGDYSRAYAEWLQRAEAGDSEAMNNIGILFNQGLGVEKDIATAADWYGRAALLGYANAQFNLANLYFNGKGLKRDLVLAAGWYRAAADRGHRLAAYYLGEMYLDGAGVEKDKRLAMTWIVKAADAGLAEAQFDIGKRLLEGDDVREDEAKGADYLLKAAAQNHRQAQALLARLYAEGRGLVQNTLEAYVWASIAAEHLEPERERRRVAELRDELARDLPEDAIAAAMAEIALRDPRPEGKPGSDLAEPPAQ